MESLRTFQIPQILKKRCKFTLRWLLDLGNISLEQNLRLKTLGHLLFIFAIFSICCLADLWLTFAYYWENSLTHLMLITAFRLSIFRVFLTGGNGGCFPTSQKFTHSSHLEKSRPSPVSPVYCPPLNKHFQIMTL